MFKDTKNELYDLRPREARPCKANLAKKSNIQLAELLGKAYEEQLKKLKEIDDNDNHFTDVATDTAQRQRRLCQTYGFSEKTGA